MHRNCLSMDIESKLDLIKQVGEEVVTEEELKTSLATVTDPKHREELESQFTETRKLWKSFEKKGEKPAFFSLWIDPDRCKGCGVCVEVCGTRDALKMREKSTSQMEAYSRGMEFIKKELPPTPGEYISEKRITDKYMRESCWVSEGGAGSCAGCGEISAINMALTATSIKYGKDMAIVAATGCNTVYSSTYPYNIFNVPWINSLFENAPATAMGVDACPPVFEYDWVSRTRTFMSILVVSMRESD